MRHHCEVCETFRPDAAATTEDKLVYMEFPTRTVRLCVGHALIAQKSGVQSFEELRDLYGEGRRSHVPRRGRDQIVDVNEQRQSIGRRATDARG